jgi:hypothetical protein
MGNLIKKVLVESDRFDQKNSSKMYKRNIKVSDGGSGFLDLDLEFEGQRAFVVWDAISVGTFMLKARVEIDPALLQKSSGKDFVYRGQLILPRPENN